MKADSVEEVHAPITDLVSANDTQSSGLMEVLKLAENKSIDFVYTSGLDRLSRNSMVLLNFLSKLRGYNVTVVTPFQIFDTKKLEDLMS
jgi:DNA invertase Pin-like site-specific DNA recombinase